MAAANRTSSLGPGCLVLFALPFAAVGVGMGVWLASTLFAYLNAQHWAETSAHILRTELKVHHGNKSNTYEVTAQFAYEFGGRKYNGSRVGLVSGADNIGPFHQNAYRELCGFQRSGKPFRCFVNPAQPEEALLYRDLRWEMAAFQMIFVLSFGGVGFGLLIGGVIAYRKQRAETAATSAHPEKPWNWRADWASGRIVTSTKNQALAVLAIAIFWNLVTAPLWLVLPRELFTKRHFGALLGLALPAIGLLLAYGAIYCLLRWRKFGQSILQLANVPGVIGGRIVGVVQTSAKIRPEDGFHLTLQSVRRITTGTGKQRRTEESKLWEEKRTVMHELLDDQLDQSAIPIEFQIPGECRPTDMQNPNDQTLWRLIAAAKVPGIDYSATFEVPVFKTNESEATVASSDDAPDEAGGPKM